MLKSYMAIELTHHTYHGFDQKHFMGQQDANYGLDGLVEMNEGYFRGISKEGERSRVQLNPKYCRKYRTMVS